MGAAAESEAKKSKRDGEPEGDIAKRKSKVPQVLRQESDSVVKRNGSTKISTLREDPATRGHAVGAKMGDGFGLAALARGQNGVQVLGESGDFGDRAQPGDDISQNNRISDILPDSNSSSSTLTRPEEEKSAL